MYILSLKNSNLLKSYSIFNIQTLLIQIKQNYESMHFFF